MTNCLKPLDRFRAYTYTPFGTTKTGVKVDPLVTNNPLKYTGQYEDPTGNYNLRARLYNPTLAIFTEVDPAPLGAGSIGESTYVYGLNNPLMYNDPSGERGQLVGCAYRNRNNPIAKAVPERLAFSMIRTQIFPPVPLPYPVLPRPMPDGSVDGRSGVGKPPPIAVVAGAGKKTCLCSCRWQTAPNSPVPCLTPFVKFEMVVTKSANCTKSCFKECNARIDSGDIVLGPECSPKHHQGRDKP